MHVSKAQAHVQIKNFMGEERLHYTALIIAKIKT